MHLELTGSEYSEGILNTGHFTSPSQLRLDSKSPNCSISNAVLRPTKLCQKSIQLPARASPIVYFTWDQWGVWSVELPKRRHEGQDNGPKAKPGLPDYLLKKLAVVLENGVFRIPGQQVLIITKDQWWLYNSSFPFS